MLLESRHPPQEGDDSTNPLRAAEKRVRGFLCGTTNPLLAQNSRLAEVIVSTLPFPSETSGISSSTMKLGDFEIPSDGGVDSNGEGDTEGTESSSRGTQFGNRSSGVLSRLLVGPIVYKCFKYFIESPGNRDSSLSTIHNTWKSTT